MDKRDTGIFWCRRGTEHTQTTDGKPRRYVLLPDTSVLSNMTFRHS